MVLSGSCNGSSIGSSRISCVGVVGGECLGDVWDVDFVGKLIGRPICAAVMSYALAASFSSLCLLSITFLPSIIIAACHGESLSVSR